MHPAATPPDGEPRASNGCRSSVCFLVLYNTLTGVRTVRPVLVNAVHTLGASRRDVLNEVILPSALPNIITGSRAGAGFAFRGFIFAEMIATKSGLGFMIFNAASTRQTSRVVVGMIAMGLSCGWRSTGCFCAPSSGSPSSAGPRAGRRGRAMSLTAAPLRPRQPRLDLMGWTGVIPFLVLAAMWFVAPVVTDIPPYKLPTIEKVWDTAVKMMLDGPLPTDIGISLGRLALGYLIGNAIAIPLGLAIALDRAVAETLRPVLSFFQSIAGIGWVPLAIISFGVGEGSVLYRAALCHGASQRQILADVVVPGALVQIIVACAPRWPMAGVRSWRRR
ncbi:MAG: hypothetical protein AcusKO_29990 [Acuticoccus sp.]